MAKIPEFVPYYLQLRWVFLQNRWASPFWTSDNPVVLHNSVPAGPLGNLGLLCRGIEVHLPLGPERVLALCDPLHFRDVPDVIDVSQDGVRTENQLQVRSATRYVFAPTDDFAAARAYLAANPRAATGRSMRVV